MLARAQVRATLAISTVLAIWAVVLTLVSTLHARPVVIGAALDLTVTAGLAMYLIAVRGGHLPRWVLRVTIGAGVVGARFLLPHSAIVVMVALEITIVLFVTGLPSPLRRMFTAELEVFSHAIAGWRRPRRAPNVFTSHRTNGWPLIASTFIGLTLVETPLVHIVLVAFGHPVAAWIATGLSLYSVAWLIGDLHALRHGGIVVTADSIELRLGVRYRGRIPRSAIARISRCSGAPRKEVDVSILGANVLLSLTHPHEIQGLLGRRKIVDALALSVDEPDRFEERLSRSA